MLIKYYCIKMQSSVYSHCFDKGLSLVFVKWLHYNVIILAMARLNNFLNSWFIVIMHPKYQGNNDTAYKRNYMIQLTFFCLLFLQNGKFDDVKVSPSKYSFLAIVSHLIPINLEKGNINYQQIIPFDIFRLMRNFRNVFLHVCQRTLL